MELKKVTEGIENTVHLQDKQSNTKPPSISAAAVDVEEEVQVEQLVEDNNRILKKSDQLNTDTPTSPLKTIQPILTCPPAPRKPKAAPLKKRKGLQKTPLRLLDYSNDVLALYPPAMLADFGNKMKKVKRSSYDHEQLKENISNNLNYYSTTKLHTTHDQ